MGANIRSPHESFNDLERLEHETGVFLNCNGRDSVVHVRLLVCRVLYTAFIKSGQPSIRIGVEVNQILVVPGLLRVFQEPLGDGMTALYATIDWIKPLVD